MALTLTILSILLIILSILPFIQHQHWIFRVPEFMKLQLLYLQLLVVPLAFLYINPPFEWVLQIILIVFLIYHISVLFRYTKFWRKPLKVNEATASKKISALSCNIYQFNTEYQRFIDLVQEKKPDIVLTMESNQDWINALKVLESDYPYRQYYTSENTYGMHLFSKLEFKKATTHFFVADDLPSMEVTIETSDGYEFVFFAVHPPPPSPTEEATSKERDGDLLSVAKAVRNQDLPVIIMGDFNSVAWAKASKLFRKTSRLIDARIGRGILATFHAKYFFFRAPLDLCYHSPEVFISNLSILPNVGSDHYPVLCEFHIDLKSSKQEELVVELEAGEMQEVNELIEEGKEEESENREED